MAIAIRHSGDAAAEEAKGTEGGNSPSHRFARFLPSRPVSLGEKALFADNLSTILDSGLSIFDSLDILEEEAKNRRLREVLRDLKGRVRAGQPLWVGLAAHPEAFPPLFVGLVKVGESGGKLVEVLSKLSAKLRKEQDLRAKIVAASMYPIIVAISMIVVAVLMMIFVVPKLAEVFAQNGAALPAQTRALIAVSDVIVYRWPLILAAIAVVAVLCVAAMRLPSVRRGWDRFVLRLPILGPIVRHTELVWFATDLRILLSSGFPVVESFELLSQTAVSGVYRVGYLAAGDRVMRGVPIAEALRADKMLFPSLLQRMVRVGETTGRLDETLGKAAAHYEAKLDAMLSGVAVLLNPLLTLLIGLFVAIVALAIIVPVYQLTGAFS